MDLSAQVSSRLSYASRILFLIVGIIFLSLSSPLIANAQTTSSLPSQYMTPNTTSDVVQNQHTFVQSITIEVLASIICQLSNIDVFNPSQGCLAVDTTSHKMTYAPPATSYQPGGLVGLGTNLLSSVYMPPASGVNYMQDLASNFGIVKHADATTKEQTGFDALYPTQKLWLSIRNITFIFFVIIFVLIGIGIMLRVHIDPRTVMTLQNQLPKIVISIILISFSYAIVGLVIDFMWVTTYVGINILTDAYNPNVVTCNVDGSHSADDGPQTLSERAYYNILNNPVAFMNDIFHQTHCDVNDFVDHWDNSPGEQSFINGIVNSGIASLSWQVGTSMGQIVQQAVIAVINPDQYGDCSLGGAAQSMVHTITLGLIGSGSGISIQACAAAAFAGVLRVVADILAILIVLIAVLVAMFRLWWSLIKAYAYIVIYTITAPFWILLGLIPGSSLGFTRWFRTIVANLIIFPAAAMLIIGARIVMELYGAGAPAATATDSKNIQPFIAPLVGNPGLKAFGAIIAFGLLMIAPELLNMMRDALKSPAGKVGDMVKGGFGVGSAAVGAGLGATWGRWTALGGYGQSSGFIRQMALGTGNPEDLKAHQKILRKLTAQRAFNAHDYPYPPPGPTGGGGAPQH